jgi:hypothetical protein
VIRRADSPTPGTPICIGCGYNLTGLTGEDSPGVCPECGRGFWPSFPYRSKPAPRPLGLLLRMSVPTLLILAVCGAVSSIHEQALELAILVLIPLLVIGGAWAAVAWPLMLAFQPAPDPCSRRHRTWTIPLGIASAAANLAALFFVVRSVL